MALKSVHVKLFGKSRYIGDIPSELITDLLSIIDFMRRGRQCRLTLDRQTAVCQALRSSGNVVDSLESLQELISSWKQEHLVSDFDASTYYSSDRATSYTATQAVAQSRHTSVVAELLGYDVGPTSLILDLGCGSGLSSTSLSTQENSFVIGVDASVSMLNLAVEVDVVLADFGHRLPFRPMVFDACASVSALHYLFNSPARSSTCLQSLARCVRGPVAAHLCPKAGGQAAIDQFAALAAPIGPYHPHVFVDQPHHGSLDFVTKGDTGGGVRWYLLLSRYVSSTPPCEMYGVIGRRPLHCLSGCGSRPLTARGAWLWAQHLRFASHVLRAAPSPLGATLRAHFDRLCLEGESVADGIMRFDVQVALMQCLHPSP